jgi:flagellar hook-associated protein 3 FlgL
MGRVLAGRSTLATIGQYADNIKQGKTRLEFNEETLKLADDLVQRARRTAEEKSGDSVTAEERALAAESVKEIYDQVLQLANSKLNGRYIFSGDKSNEAAFTRDESYNATYNGDAGSFRIPIADNVQVNVDADGSNYFGDGVTGVFFELKQLITGLQDSNSTQIRATIDPLEDAHVQIMNKRSEAGPKLYRLQATEEHWTNVKNTVQAAIGREEDVDVAQAIIELKNLETAYQSTMAAASRIIQPSLVNFLK